MVKLTLEKQTNLSIRLGIADNGDPIDPAIVQIDGDQYNGISLPAGEHTLIYRISDIKHLYPGVSDWYDTGAGVQILALESAGIKYQTVMLTEIHTVVQPDIVSGDVNGDGSIDIRDLIAMKKLAADNGYSETADLNGDGNLNADDIAQMKKYLLKVIA